MSTTSKQDRQGSRTPADLERKYDLGAMDGRFAEVMGIATDAQTHVEKLDDNVHSAEFLIEVINGESTAKISADKLDIEGKTLDIKVEATNITGKLTAEQIDATELEVDAANIKGKLNAEQIEVEDLSALGATIGGWSVSPSELSRTSTDNSVEHKLKLSADSIESTRTMVSSGDKKKAALRKGILNVFEDRPDVGSDGYAIAYYSNLELRTQNAGYLIYIDPNDNLVKAKRIVGYE